MRLIDADELIEIAHEMIQEDPDAFNGGYSYDAVTVEEINEAPTVEAVPVVHGEWIHVPSSDMATGRAYECSNCKKMRYGSFMPPFCQMCGADMRTSAE